MALHAQIHPWVGLKSDICVPSCQWAGNASIVPPLLLHVDLQKAFWTEIPPSLPFRSPSRHLLPQASSCTGLLENNSAGMSHLSFFQLWQSSINQIMGIFLSNCNKIVAPLPPLLFPAGAAAKLQLLVHPGDVFQLLSSEGGRRTSKQEPTVG